jgi:hypothetical protein
MTKFIAAIILVSASGVADAQHLTPAQKQADLHYLASLFATYYAPLDWKKQLLGFDALDLAPWLDRAAKTTNDLDFYDLEVEYVGSLKDTHATFILPSDFIARLGFTVDIYDGAILIDSINRAILPQTEYPFAIGDELVSVDGKDVQQAIKDLGRFANYGGNPIASRRLLVGKLVTRAQSTLPHAVDVGESASVVIRRQSGAFESYTIPWSKTGTPLEVGPVPSPMLEPRSLERPNDHLDEVEKAQFSGDLQVQQTGLLNYGATTPMFLGALSKFDFTRRLGASSSDFFYSGVFVFDGLKIGFLRIPNYTPSSTPAAVQQLEKELAYFNDNTDGLIVDEMHNSGGNLCFGETVAAHLIPYPFRATGYALRPYWTRILGYYSAMIKAKANGESLDVIQQYEQVYNAMLAANTAGKLVTDPLPLCSSSLDKDPAKDRNGNVIAYTKPIVMIMDEFSISTADSVAATFQDAGRGLLYGMRSGGAGGNNTTFNAGPYTEGVTGMTLALQVRKNAIAADGYPTSQFIENIGVRPDFPNDYMTKENLLQSGLPFVTGLLQHTAAHIRSKQ